MLDRVQFLRKKAQEAGNLKSGEQQNVSTQTDGGKTVVVIEPAAANRGLCAGCTSQPWSMARGGGSHIPLFTGRRHRTTTQRSVHFGFVWGASIGGVHNSMWGGCNWSHNEVNIMSTSTTACM